MAIQPPKLLWSPRVFERSLTPGLYFSDICSREGCTCLKAKNPRTETLAYMYLSLEGLRVTIRVCLCFSDICSQEGCKCPKAKNPRTETLAYMYLSLEGLRVTIRVCLCFSDICSREGCTCPKAKNPRTGDLHNHCSMKCMRLDQAEKTTQKEGIKPG